MHEHPRRRESEYEPADPSLRPIPRDGDFYQVSVKDDEIHEYQWQENVLGKDLDPSWILRRCFQRFEGFRYARKKKPDREKADDENPEFAIALARNVHSKQPVERQKRDGEPGEKNCGVEGSRENPQQKRLVVVPVAVCLPRPGIGGDGDE